jgi:hypothetical protein
VLHLVGLSIQYKVSFTFSLDVGHPVVLSV